MGAFVFFQQLIFPITGFVIDIKKLLKTRSLVQVQVIFAERATATTCNKTRHNTTSWAPQGRHTGTRGWKLRKTPRKGYMLIVQRAGKCGVTGDSKANTYHTSYGVGKNI